MEAWTNLLEEGFRIDVVYLDYRKGTAVCFSFWLVS